MAENKNHPRSLCWKCKNTNRFKCSWFNTDDQQPVPGWVAERLDRAKVGIGVTYHVIDCPNFAPEDPQTKTHRLTITGVHYLRKLGKWQADIRWCGKLYYLGVFKEQQDAIAARRAAEEAIRRGQKPRSINRRKKA